METTTKTPKNKVGLVFGHKVEDMKESISKMESLGFEPVVVTWLRYDKEFPNHKTYSQATPPNQGMDCINLFLLSKELAFEKLGKREIGAVANHHTTPTLWNWDLSLSDWKKLFDFGPVKRNVSEVVVERYIEFFLKDLKNPTLVGGDGKPLYPKVEDGVEDSDI
jgi:hypothetical protein